MTYFITIIVLLKKAVILYYHISTPKANLKMYHSQGIRGRKLICGISSEPGAKIAACTPLQRYALSMNKTDGSKIQIQN